MGDTPAVGPVCTNFAAMSHRELKAMLETASSSSLCSDAEVWRKARDTLSEIAEVLGTAAKAATRTWEGETSDAFLKRMSRLSRQMHEAAENADNTYQALVMSADAIDQAKAEMPEEPSLVERGLDLVDDGRFFGDDGSAAEKLRAKMADGKSREDAAAELEGELSEAESRRQKAVVVMQTLAARYSEVRPLLKPRDVRRWEDPDKEISASDSDPSSAVAASAAITGVGAGVTAADFRGRDVGERHGSPTGANGKAAVQSRGSSVVPATQTDPGPGTTIDSAGTLSDGSKRTPTVSPEARGNLPQSGAFDSGGMAGHQPNGIVPRGTRTPGAPGGLLPRGAVQSGAGGGGSRQSMTRPIPPGAAPGGITGGRPIPSQKHGTGAKRPGRVVGEEPNAGKNGRTFTPGGSGIAGGRRGHDPRSWHGMPLSTGVPAGRQEQKERRNRPDYLVEDEDTWVPQRSVSPRVVE